MQVRCDTLHAYFLFAFDYNFIDMHLQIWLLKKFRVISIVVLFFSLGLISFSQAQTKSNAYYGTVTRVSDGDTLWLRPEISSSRGLKDAPIKLRLKGVDAPERCQPWGQQAQAALSDKTLNRRVRWLADERDDYGRRLGHVWLDGEDVSAWMVSQGHAWSYRFRGAEGPYFEQEIAARQSRRGLFSDANAVRPRQFRKSHGPCP